MAEEKKIVLSIETITDQTVMEAYGETLDKVLGTYEENMQALAEYNLQMKKNEERIKELHKLTEKNIQLTSEQTNELKALTAQNIQMAQAKAKTLQILKSEEKIALATKGSMEEQALVLGKLREAWRGMTDEQKANNQGMLETIKTLDESLKKSDAEIGNFQRNVGNYAGGIAQALGRLDILPDNIATYISAISRLNVAFNNISRVVYSSALPAIKAFSASLLTIKGIGAFVAITTLGVLVSKLASSWTDASNAQDIYQNKLAEINREQERFKELLDKIKLDNETFSANLIAKYADEILKAKGNAEQLRAVLLKLREEQEGEREREIQTEAAALLNRRKEIDESLQGLQREIDEASVKVLVKLGYSREVAEEQVKNGFNRLSEAQKKYLDEQLSDLYKSVADRSSAYNKELNDIIASLQRLANEAKTIKATAIVENAEEDVAKADKLAEQRRRKAEADEKKRLAEAAKSQARATEILEKGVTAALERSMKERAKLVKEGSKEMHAEMKDSIDEAKDFFTDELAKMNEEIANDPELNKVAESAFARAIGVSDEELAEIKQQAQKAAQDIFNSIAKISQEATQRRLKDDLEAVEREANSEKDILEAKLEKGLISQKEYEKKLAELDEETAARKEELNREAFEKNKAWNIGQALMNMALAITNIWATNKGGMAARIAETVIATASGVAQIATIAAQKYARGGELHGASHAQGGIKGFVGNRHIEAEGGEIIINKRSSAKHRKLLSLINSDNGWGDDFAHARGGNGRFFARGGVLGGYDFRTAPLPDTTSGLAKFAQQQTANIQSAISAINQRIDNLRVSVLLSDIETKSNEKRVHISRAVL